MKAEKMDRRSERTRRLLSAALMTVLQEKRYDEITVQDILDRANIGRSTFYAHYYDKEDLLSSELERVIEVLSHHLGHAPENTATGIPSLGLFRHLQEQKRLYQAFMRGPGAETITRTMHTILSRRVEQQIHANASRPLPPLAETLVAQAVVGSFLALLRWWAETDMVLAPEEIDSYFQRLVLPGIRQVLAAENSK